MTRENSPTVRTSSGKVSSFTTGLMNRLTTPNTTAMPNTVTTPPSMEMPGSSAATRPIATDRAIHCLINRSMAPDHPPPGADSSGATSISSRPRSRIRLSSP